MESVTIKSELNQDDWRAYLRAAQGRSFEAQRKPFVRILLKLPTAYFVALGTWLVVAIIQDWNTRLPIIALASLCAYTWLWQLIIRLAENAPTRGLFIGPNEIEFSERGMNLRRQGYESFCSWALFQELTETETHFYVWMDRFTAQTIPLRDLPSGLTPAMFKDHITAFAARGAAATTSLPATSPEMAVASVESVEVPQPSMAKNGPAVARELTELAKLFVRFRVDGRLLQGRDLTIVLLFTLAAGLCVGLERLQFGAEAEFIWYGVVTLPLFLFYALVTAWLLARMSRPRIALARTTLLIAGLAPLAAATYFGGNLLGKTGQIICWAVFGGTAFHYLANGLKSLSLANQRPAFLISLVWLAGITYATNQVHDAPNFWYAPEEYSKDDFGSPGKHDALLFRQAERIDSDIDAMPSGDGSGPRMFFLGFAGFAHQRVFAEEIALAASAAGERFGIGARSLQLVNDHRDLEKRPLATLPALRHALVGIARKMNLEDDILFLAISSHGGKNGDISVAVNPELMMFPRDIYPADLKALLDEAGIRWRVIVVSACYSGTYVEPLADDRTIVITASAKDRTSFGCADDRELTYFGEAFFRDALPHSATLRQAFESARKAIETREGNELFARSSSPQAHFGKLAERKLAELDTPGDASASAQGR